MIKSVVNDSFFCTVFLLSKKLLILCTNLIHSKRLIAHSRWSQNVHTSSNNTFKPAALFCSYQISYIFSMNR